MHEVFVPGRKGSLQIEMLASARRHGRVATVIPGTLEALMRETHAGHPVLVLQNLGLSWAPAWHYAVVVGYDLPEQTVLLRSGDMPRQALPLRTFEHTWARSNYWAFVALPPGQLAASADERATTSALVAFERNAQPAAASTAYAAALARWPQSLTLAMGLGNTQYAAGDRAAAAQTFATAAQQHHAAAAYNNWAQVLLELGQCTAAREAAALALAAKDSLDAATQAALRRMVDAPMPKGVCKK